jgi:hypothetical protein
MDSSVTENVYKIFVKLYMNSMLLETTDYFLTPCYKQQRHWLSLVIQSLKIMNNSIFK